MDRQALDELLGRVQLAGAQRGEGMFGGVGEEDVQRAGRSPVAVGGAEPGEDAVAGVHCWLPIGAARESMASVLVRRVRRWR
ncbi:hypothetical protein ABT095_30650 [Kitasatospora sp. NPDC002227]|uniref:hypothetical protein n=1 Tax=Kitasatospora sp. NPDC002227 TaxID=3154773 RepID=UPI00331B5F25